jgi:site-specific recombinase XerD
MRKIAIDQLRRSQPGQPPSLGKLLAEFLDRLITLNYSPRSVECYYYDCLGFVQYLERWHAVGTAAALRQAHLYAWQQQVANGDKTRAGLPLKARAVNKKITSVRGFLRHLAAQGQVRKDYLEGLKRVIEPQTLPLGVVSHAKIRKIIARIERGQPDDYRDRTILELMYSSGLRADEVVRLDVRSVDFKNAVVTVLGKGKKERVVPIGKTALRCLETYVHAVRPFLLNGAEKNALFLNKTGGRLQQHTLRIIVHRHGDYLLPDDRITPHTFRRSCATELIRGGANLYHVKDLLGHESLETIKHYVKLTILDLKATHAKCHPREKDA